MHQEGQAPYSSIDTQQAVVEIENSQGYEVGEISALKEEILSKIEKVLQEQGQTLDQLLDVANSSVENISIPLSDGKVAVVHSKSYRDGKSFVAGLEAKLQTQEQQRSNEQQAKIEELEAQLTAVKELTHAKDVRIAELEAQIQLTKARELRMAAQKN